MRITRPVQKTSRKGGRPTLPLEAARRAAGLTLTELARRTGLSLSTLSKIEHGHEKPHPSTRRLIALELKIEWPLKSGAPTIR